VRSASSLRTKELMACSTLVLGSARASTKTARVQDFSLRVER
jgi:hypothetical protein